MFGNSYFGRYYGHSYFGSGQESESCNQPVGMVAGLVYLPGPQKGLVFLLGMQKGKVVP